MVGTLYTGWVNDGILHKEAGLTRYLTISRLSDNSGKNPREDLWKGVKTENGLALPYDLFLPCLAPNGVEVKRWYDEKIDWGEFVRRYHEKLEREEEKIHLESLSVSIARELDLGREGVIQCVCPKIKRDNCHRTLLAEKIAQTIRERFGERPVVREF